MSQRLVHGRIFADRFEGNATSRFRSCACQEKMCSIFIACSIVYSLLSNRPYTIFSSNGARQKKSLKPEFQVIFFSLNHLSLIPFLCDKEIHIPFVCSSGLESCPFCDYCEVLPEGEKVFQCRNPECGKMSCRRCREMNHAPLRCAESSMETRLRTYVEERMTRALLRTCPNCQKTFMKAEGCNKMV